MLAWIKQKRNAAAVVVIVAALLVGGAVSAQAVLTPSGHHTWGSFAACVAKSNGAMRLVGANASACKSTETPVKWNSAGSPNGTGKTGAEGPKGDPGDDGQQGPAGEKGEQGAKGETGAAGENGDDGAPGAPGEQGDPGLSELESDGPYPGVTDLGDLDGQGDNSDDMVAAGEHTTVWVTCPTGKVALGGGFRLAADSTLEAAKAIHVIASEPRGESIEGDVAGSILPIGWQVEVVNNGDTEQIVRPWVTCAGIAAPAAE